MQGAKEGVFWRNTAALGKQITVSNWQVTGPAIQNENTSLVYEHMFYFSRAPLFYKPHLLVPSLAREIIHWAPD